MQLEGVLPIAVRGLRLKILGKVDDLDGLKRALFDADTATNAQLLRKLRDLVGWGHLDTQLAHANDRA